jgi:NUMOD3 motif
MLLNTHDDKFGFNIKPTDPNGKSHHSPESIEKAKNSRKGYRHSEETKEKLRIAHLGQKPKPKTIDGLRRMSEAHKGKKVSESVRLKMSIAQTGKTRPLETRLKMGKSKLNHKFNLGKILPTRKKVQLLNLDFTVFKEFAIASDLAKYLNLSTSYTAKLCREGKQYKNFYLKYN